MTLPGNTQAADFHSWIGRSEEIPDVATVTPVRALAASLDNPTSDDHGAPVPPLWHWLYFLPRALTSELAEDGHLHKGGFLPPIPKPRRMWAGGQLEFHAPLRIGAALRRKSTVVDVAMKEGRSGSMYFVKVRHDVHSDGQLAVVEHHDIVYRDPAPASAASVPQRPTSSEFPSWSRSVQPSAPLLFRYSALTFNSHRIHYDRTYATEVEGYAGLVVHGPLLATLMLDLVRRELPSARIRQFSFKARRPVFDIASFQVCGRLTDEKTVSLWISDADGARATVGTALLE